MPAAALDVRALSAGYGRTHVLEEVSFRVPAGGRLAILGRNGMGKTTLLASLMGLTRRYAGSIGLDGRDITALGTAERALAGLGLVPQAREVFRGLSVEENLFTGLKGRPRPAIAEAYGLFPRLYERRRHLGAQLSGGEQQMLATARTILGQPSVLLLDEPLEGLAPIICDMLMEAFARLAASGATTILLVEQRLESALAFAEAVVILERGRIVWSGSPGALRADAELIERHLGVGGLR
ncbi:ABC transporter ATP-binding protein [Bosea sp. (in: a-proteobacteria)]|uniref:ABC transporter ATP-binding protein n=1 Tax=Bosea sp. (in: a-proteobacteria) TaxID=1871050 RepID=UPI002632297C|nr:ABC transporter ATP-binding protein [Bosea sp. (in: a-proteobacteria)]MCO5090023.1 ABC transporter ATP-binding protein [Bosea sp. (in: a-proteobacteria)]